MLETIEKAKIKIMLENQTYEELRERVQELEQGESRYKRAETELLANGEKFRQLFEATSDAVFVHLLGEDDSPGPFIEVNDIACQRLGYTREALLRLTPAEIRYKGATTDPAQTTARLRARGALLFETVHVTKKGRQIPVESHLRLFDYKGKQAVLSISRDITKRKQAEKALQESEETVRKKLQAILEPDGDLGVLNLSDIIDHRSLQAMMEEFYRITNVGSAVLDISGKVLVAVGWQDICIKFHRCHPETLKNCLESDTILSHGVPAGTFKAYRCKNNLWDMVTPVVVGGRHLGNIFIGQFFYDDEVLDRDLFRSQARQYGFDETAYLAAVDRVPSWSRETVDAAMAFYAKLAGMISSLSYSTVSLSRALSQQEAVLRKLSESEERFRALHNASFGGIAIHDQGLILECNRGLSEITGFSLDELIGMNGLSLISDDMRETVVENITAGYEKPYEVTGIRKNGETYPLRLEARNIPYRGKYVRVVEFRDITESKRAEKEKENLEGQLRQAQKMESVGRLAGGVAHDFNNMLGVILGHAEMAMDVLDPALPIHGDLQEIRKAAERSADLTRQLLAFARKQIVAPRVLDLNETVESMLAMLRRLIGENIDLAWLPGKNLGAVKVDPSQIDQVLANLCVNARDAITGTGKLTIETGAATFDDAYCAVHAGFVPGEFVLMAVSDDGCGMDAETRANLFEPFYTTKGVGEGTGLGLAMVYGMVKQNDGFINVYSEPGQGTTIKIYLPRHRGRAGQIREKSPAESDNLGIETVLLVEDEPAILNMTRQMLQRLGYTVVAAATPGDAIRLAREGAGQIDLLMTDVVMPEMNGRDLAKNLLSLYPDLKRLFMSGYTANVIAHHGVLDEGVHFIQKPFSKADLAVKIREVLSKTGAG